MKTPRDLLLERHRLIGPKLDELRRATLDELPVSLARSRRPNPVEPGPLWRWMAGLRPLHRQLAAMSALWVVVAVLNHESDRASGTVAFGHNPVAPRQILAAIRENRRQLWELIQSPVLPPPPVPQAGIPGSLEESIYESVLV